jgi:hypothetical protein
MMTSSINHWYEVGISLLGHNALWRDTVNIISTRICVSFGRTQITPALKVIIHWGIAVSSYFLCVTTE